MRAEIPINAMIASEEEAMWLELKEFFSESLKGTPNACLTIVFAPTFAKIPSFHPRAEAALRRFRASSRVLSRGSENGRSTCSLSTSGSHEGCSFRRGPRNPQARKNKQNLWYFLYPPTPNHSKFAVSMNLARFCCNFVKFRQIFIEIYSKNDDFFFFFFLFQQTAEFR